MQEISSLFEMKLTLIQKDLNFLKSEIEKGTGKLVQQGKHRDQIVKALSKTVSGHIGIFKKALQVHNENTEQRQKRVTKYGQGVDQLKPVGTTSSAVGNIEQLGTTYAMFAPQNNFNSALLESGIGLEKQNSLRNRKPPPSVSSKNETLSDNNSSKHDNSTKKPSNLNDNFNDEKKIHSRGGTGYFSNYGRRKNIPETSIYQDHQPQQKLQQVSSSKLKVKDDSRLKEAEKVEASIMQVSFMGDCLDFLVILSLLSDGAAVLSDGVADFGAIGDPRSH